MEVIYDGNTKIIFDSSRIRNPDEVQRILNNTGIRKEKEEEVWE